MSDEEVNARLRERGRRAQAQGARARRAARPLADDLARAARTPTSSTRSPTPRGAACTATPTRTRRELRRELAAPPRRRARARSSSATAPRSCSAPPRSALLDAGRRAGHAVALLPALPAHGAPRRAATPSRSPGFGVDAVLARGHTSARASSRSATPTTRPASCSPPRELRRLLDGAARARRRAARRGARATSSTPSRPTRTLALLDDHPRLLVFRTFSKAWGLAGLRCGYAIGGPGSRAAARASSSPPLGVGELAQAGALEALRTLRASWSRARRAAVVAERRAPARRAARRWPSTPPPSQANFVWLRAPGHRRRRARGAARRAGVLVAPGATARRPRPRPRRRSSDRRGDRRACSERALRRDALERDADAQRSVAGGLAQQRAGRLLEDLAPGARLLLLGREVLDDLAHARGRDLDAVALADLAGSARSPRRASA